MFNMKFNTLLEKKYKINYKIIPEFSCWKILNFFLESACHWLTGKYDHTEYIGKKHSNMLLANVLLDFVHVLHYVICKCNKHDTKNNILFY